MRIHYLLFPILFIFSSCVSSKVTERGEFYSINAYDFREYTENNFLFTPEMYTGDYESIGIIRIEYMPSFINIPSGAPSEQLRSYTDNYVMRDPVENNYWRISRPDQEEIINMAYIQAVNMGADAVVNFNLGSTITENGDLRVPTLVLTGFAIQRN